VAVSRSLPICQSQLLLAVPHLVHGITRRVAGLGKADGNLGYSAPRDRDDAWEMRGRWAAALGLDRDALIGAHQVHGAAAHVVHAGEIRIGPAPQADALMTADRGPALLTLHADCMPIILCDPDVPAIATVHAGWRGTAMNIAGKTVARMAAEFGARPERLVAFLGPAIGACCYEVGADVREAWSANPGADSAHAIRAQGDRWRFDLEAGNRWLLTQAGLAELRIESSGVCTKCGGDQWFSHRGQGPLTGRYGSIAALR